MIPEDFISRVKRYSNRKYSISIIETVYALFLMYAFTASGMSIRFAALIAGTQVPAFFILPLYLLLCGSAFAVFLLPLSYYGSFKLEHDFGLSRQNLKAWLIDQFKAGIVGFIVSWALVGALYAILARFAAVWWIVVWLAWTLFSVVLARIAPVVIIPLFFKSVKLKDESLRSRIFALAQKMKISLMDVFEINFSTKTVKANAAFTGWGSTRRVLLADTLTGKFTHDEIEVIMAHEFAHYRMRHVWKLMLIQALVTLTAFYLIYATSPAVLAAFHLGSLSGIESLPVVFMYFSLLGVVTQPVQAFFSRVMERSADRVALGTTGMKEAFISTMEKLATQNLSDRNPHPLIKFYFYDHPPVDERIALARRS